MRERGERRVRRERGEEKVSNDRSMQIYYAISIFYLERGRLHLRDRVREW